MHGSDYSSLLDNKAVRRWRDNVARGSVITAEVYLRRLGHFCKDLEIEPSKLLEMSEDELYNLLLDTVSKMEGKGYSGGYIHSTVKAIKSWLVHNRKEVRGKIKVRGAQDTPTLKDERVPMKNELKRVFLAGDEKSRVACVLMAHGGLRPETRGHYHGNDGLTLRDLPELHLENREVTFLKVPAMVIVRRELSKAGHQYFTFLGREACDYLRDYLEGRLREGEQLSPDSAMVTPKQKMKAFIRTSNVGDAIRDCIRNAGFPWRPYVLRSYFDTQLMLAESKGLVLRDYRQFWMGHKGDIENRYTTNKQRLPESVAEDMRAAYARSEEFLQTTEKEETSEEKLRESFRKQLLLVSGFGREELDKMDLASVSDEDLQRLVRKKMLGLQGSNGGSQKVVSVSEANDYLAKGWEYVAKISDNQVIIKMNHSTNA